MSIGRESVKKINFIEKVYQVFNLLHKYIIAKLLT